MPSKKELEKAKKKQEEKELLERKQKEDAEWEVGVNKKANEREKKKQEKQEEKMAKNKIVNELLEVEDYTIKGKKPKTKRGKDDFKLLNEALKSVPKTKQQREKEEKEKDQERKTKELMLLNDKKKEQQIKEEEEEKKLRQRGIITNTDFDMKFENKSLENEVNISSIDGAIDLLNNNKQNIKDIYKSFYDEQMIILKADNPGLRLSQYNDRIQKLWRNSPMNPKNKID